jgi:hypothetical protein
MGSGEGESMRGLVLRSCYNLVEIFFTYYLDFHFHFLREQSRTVTFHLHFHHPVSAIPTFTKLLARSTAPIASFQACLSSSHTKLLRHRTPSPSVKMADLARDELVRTFKSLLSSGKYSDFVITCGSDTHNVHKAVVCSRSGFFERAERFPVGTVSQEWCGRSSA